MKTPTHDLGKDNKFSWNFLLKKVSERDRNSYCWDLFVDDEQELLRCKRPHIFCKFQCEEIVNPIENLLNYHCYQDCIRQTKIESKESPKPESPQVNYLTWVPKSGAKCDYKPSGEEVFVNCHVKNITKIDNADFAEIDYLIIEGSYRNVVVRFPSPNLLKCGKGLTIRTDCDEATNGPNEDKEDGNKRR